MNGWQIIDVSIYSFINHALARLKKGQSIMISAKLAERCLYGGRLAFEDLMSFNLIGFTYMEEKDAYILEPENPIIELKGAIPPPPAPRIPAFDIWEQQTAEWLRNRTPIDLRITTVSDFNEWKSPNPQNLNQ